MLDMRSYRGPNGENRQTDAQRRARASSGREQSAWLKRELLASRATWKVIAADMPLGLVVYHDAGRTWGSEAVAQGNGPALGRELEIADLLRFIKHNDVRNVVWITADVHYCATHLYEPGRAQFTDFEPVLRVRRRARSTPAASARTSSTTPSALAWSSRRTPAGRVNAAADRGGLYFGHVRIDGKSAP